MSPIPLEYYLLVAGVNFGLPLLVGLAVAAAEAAVGLSIVLSFFRLRKTVRADEADLLRN